MTRVVVYSRTGCGCCARALETLRAAAVDYPLALDVIDVDGDPKLKAEHGARVPVVEVDGVERFHGQVNPVLLRRLLTARKGGDGDGDR